MFCQNIKIIVLTLLCLVFVLAPIFTLAQSLEISYPSLPFPGVETPNEFMLKIRSGDYPDDYPSEKALALYVKYFYHLFITLAGLIAFAVITFGGLQYLVSFGSPAKMIVAKEYILGGFLGLIILLFSYLILIAINPQLAVFDISKKLALIPEPEYYNACINGRCVPLVGTKEDECQKDADCPVKLPAYREIPLGRMVEWIVKESAETRKAAEKVKDAAKILETLTGELKELLKECDCKYSCPSCVGCPPVCSEQEIGCEDFTSFENCYIAQSEINCDAEQYYQGPCDSGGCFCAECVGGLTVAETERPEGNLGEKIDTRNYFFPAGAPGVNISSGEYFKPLIGQGTGSTHGRTPVRYQKSSDPSFFEDFGYDSNYIYHYRDTTWATGPNQNVKCSETNDDAYFTLMDGQYGSQQNTCPVWDRNREGSRWIPANMEVGQLFSTYNTVVGFNKNTEQCCETQHTGPGWHTVYLTYQGCIQFPNEIIREDVIIVYSLSHNETFFYDRELGWIGFYWGDNPAGGNYLTDYQYSQTPTGECLNLATNSGLEFAYSPCDPCPNRAQIIGKQSQILTYLTYYRRLITELVIVRSRLVRELSNLELAEALMRDSLSPVLSYDQFRAIDLKEMEIKKIINWAHIDYKDDPNTLTYDNIEDPTTFYLAEQRNEDLINLVEAINFEVLSPPPAQISYDFYSELCDNCNIVLRNTAEQIKSNSKERFASQHQNSKIKADCGGIDCWDYVVQEAKNAGMNPIVALSLWGAESHFSKANAWDMGCVYHPKTSKEASMNNIIDQVNCFKAHALQEHNWDYWCSDNTTEFCSFMKYWSGGESCTLSNNANFYGNFIWFYNEIAETKAPFGCTESPTLPNVPLPLPEPNEPLPISPPPQPGSPFLIIPPLSQRDPRWAKGIIDLCPQTTPIYCSKEYHDDSMYCAGCGPTSLAMVLRYFNHRVCPYADIASNMTREDFSCGTGSAHGSTNNGIGRIASSYGISFITIGFRQIEEQLKLGRPIIARCQDYFLCYNPPLREKCGHLSVIYGIDENYVYFQDPIRGPDRQSISQALGPMKCDIFYAFYR